jgi:hypothetical protein
MRIRRKNKNKTDNRKEGRTYNYLRTALCQKCPHCREGNLFTQSAVLMILLQPYFIRLSRVVWLSFFVKYDKDWLLNGEAVESDVAGRQDSETLK